MSDYTPIDCGLYSRYELAILRRRRLRLSWRVAGGLTRIDTVTPIDLETRSGEEFLVIEQSTVTGSTSASTGSSDPGKCYPKTTAGPEIAEPAAPRGRPVLMHIGHSLPPLRV